MRTLVVFLFLFAVALMVNATVGGVVTCEGCKLLIKFAEDRLAANSTEQQIQSFLEDMCSHVPARVKSECDGLVDNYLPELITILESVESPDKACGTLHLC